LQYRVLELEARNSVSGTRKEALREKCDGKGKERKKKEEISRVYGYNR